MASKKSPKVFLDIMIGAEPLGRITFELFSDLVPKTAENFRGLCTGEYGITAAGGRNVKLSYQNSRFHRIIDKFVIQGGDILNGDGTGCVSIYGPKFNDENFTRRHSCAGLLSMANSGRNTNGCQFFITLKEAPHLDNKHVVFGQVIDGMDIVRKIAKVPCDIQDRPKIPVIITDCQQINDARNYIWQDPFQKTKFDELEKKKKLLDDARKEATNADDLNKDTEEEEKMKEVNLKIEQIKQLDQKIKDLDSNKVIQGQEVSSLGILDKISDKQKDRLSDIRLKLNEARRQNTKAVLEEERIAMDPNVNRNKKMQKIREKKEQREKELEFKGLDKDKTYLTQTALRAQQEDLKNQKKEVANFGWNIFNTDNLYMAYEKRCKRELKTGDEVKKDIKEQQEKFEPSTEQLNRLSESVKKQDERKKSFSRKRTANIQEDVTWVNKRNQVFNQKLNRSFGQYVGDTKIALERKTAD